MADSRLQQCCELVVFLERNGSMEVMKREAEKFLRSLNEVNIRSFPLFSHRLVIDVMELFDHCGDLGETLLQEPFRLQELCENVLYSCLQTVGNTYEKIVDPCQLHVTIRLKAVPTVVVEPNPRNYNGIVCINGLLLALTKPSTYIVYSVWVCPEECEGNEVVLHHLPEQAPRCVKCKSTLFEQSSTRRCGERVTATLKIRGQILPRLVTVSDDLIENLTPGTEYFASGVIVKKSLHAWCMEKRVHPHYTPVMPDGVKELYEECDGAPWKFTYCLASSLASDVCPRNEFMHLKMSLLLSLASLENSQNTERGIVHVLAAGPDNGYVPRIMDEAAKYTNRSVHVGGVNTTMQDALLASSDGVCILPLPMHAYPQKLTHKLLAAMESNEVGLDDRQVKLACAVWAHGCDHKKFQIQSVASVFGMVCRGSPSSDEDLGEFILQKAIDNTSSQDDRAEAAVLKDYLKLVCGTGTVVSMNAEAEYVLSQYFTAARQKSKGFSWNINVLTAHALAALCRASARLCARRSAGAGDALLAVWLHASACIAPNDLTTPKTVTEFELMMENFKTWLEDYVTND